MALSRCFRRFLFGYDQLVDHPRPLNKHTVVKPSSRSKHLRFDFRSPVVRVSAGCHVDGACEQFPNLGNPIAALHGLVGRVCAQTPEPDKDFLRRLAEFSRRLFEKRLRTIPRSELSSFDEWLELTSYTETEKEILRILWHEFYPDVDNSGDPAHSRRRQEILRILAFIKAEFYPTFKLLRGILGRSDLAKILLGPIIKTVETYVYEWPEFIKHIPWGERPMYLGSRFSQFRFFQMSDFTSFEASCKRELSEAVEGQLYQHLVPDLAEWLMDCFYSTDHIFMRDWTITKGIATRNSGEVNTALANALLNLCVTMFMLTEELHIPHYVLVIEGDDSLIGTYEALVIPESLYAKFGLIAKLEYTMNFNHASFCGMIFTEDGNIQADPRKVLKRLAWFDGQYKEASQKKLLALLRGKVLCFLHQYRNCPVISVACLWVLRGTAGIRPEFRDKHYLFNEYVSPEWTDDVVITPEARQLCEDVFGISSSEQLSMESWFETSTFGPIPLFDCLKDNGQEEFFDDHVLEFPERTFFPSYSMTPLDLCAVFNERSAQGERVLSSDYW